MSGLFFFALVSFTMVAIPLQLSAANIASYDAFLPRPFTTPDNNWNLAAEIGLGHDSQILTTSDHDNNVAIPLNGGGARAELALAGQVKLSSDDQTRLHALFGIAGHFSQSNQYVQGDELFPYFALPYVYYLNSPRSRAFMIAPGVESTYVDFDRSSKLSNTLNSYFVDMLYLWPASQNWSSFVELRLQSDDSQLPGSTVNGPQNPDATVLTLKKEEIFFLNKGRSRGMVAHIMWAGNEAQGTEEKYQAWEFATRLLQRAPKAKDRELDWSLGGKVIAVEFPDRIDGRQDIRYQVQADVSGPIVSAWSWAAKSQWTENHSALAVFDYCRFENYLSVIYKLPD